MNDSNRKGTQGSSFPSDKQLSNSVFPVQVFF